MGIFVKVRRPEFNSFNRDVNDIRNELFHISSGLTDLSGFRNKKLTLMDAATTLIRETNKSILHLHNFLPELEQQKQIIQKPEIKIQGSFEKQLMDLKKRIESI
ncbi:MAG: hypothetical protein ABH817_00920 [archaeon]